MKKNILLQGLLFLLSLTLSQAQTVNFNSNVACFGSQSILAGSSTFADTSIATWRWDLDNDGQFDDAIGKVQHFVFSQADTFTVGLKITTHLGVSDSIRHSVVVWPLPQVNFYVNNLCVGQSATYISNSTIAYGSIAQYLWDFNNDGITDNNSAGSQVEYNSGSSATTFQTRLECVSNLGCHAFAEKTAQVYPTPHADFTVSGNCLGESIHLINTTVIDTPGYHVWSFGNGQNYYSNGDLTHVFTSPQVYHGKLISTSIHNCRDSIMKDFEINALPAPTLSYSSDTILYPGQHATLSVIEDYASYVWSDGSVGSSIDINHSGVYNVTVTTAQNCSSNVQSHHFYLIDFARPALPKKIIMSPNGDGINDTFIIENLASYGTCSLTIYNAWNEEVFSSKDYANNFDGRDKNKNRLEGGAYYFVLKSASFEEVKGVINILK